MPVARRRAPIGITIGVIVGAVFLAATAKCSTSSVRVRPGITGRVERANPPTLRAAPARRVLDVGESAGIGSLRGTVTGADVVFERERDFTHVSGFYLVVKYTVTNTGTQVMDARSVDWRVTDPGGSLELGSGLGPEEIDFFRTLAPGESASGVIPILLGETRAAIRRGIYTVEWSDLFACHDTLTFESSDCTAEWRVRVS